MIRLAAVWIILGLLIVLGFANIWEISLWISWIILGTWLVVYSIKENDDEIH